MNHDPTQGHDELGDWAAAYALGALEPDDRRTFERHLGHCDRCADDVNSFAPIPGLLAQVDASDLRDPSPEKAAEIGRRAAIEAMSLRSSRNRWRTAATAGAAAVVLLVGLVTVVDSGRSSDDSEPSTFPASVIASQAAVTNISTSPREWGTEIVVDVDGLPARTQYQLWTVDDAGAWELAATWGPTASGGANVTGATALTTDTIDRVVVTSLDRTDIIIDTST